MGGKWRGVLRGYQNCHWCVGSQGREWRPGNPHGWGQDGLPPMANIMQIASAKSRNMGGASHQPGFIGSCLTIRHMCLPCLPVVDRLVLVFYGPL